MDWKKSNQNWWKEKECVCGGGIEFEENREVGK